MTKENKIYLRNVLGIDSIDSWFNCHFNFLRNTICRHEMKAGFATKIVNIQNLIEEKTEITSERKA